MSKIFRFSQAYYRKNKQHASFKAVSKIFWAAVDTGHLVSCPCCTRVSKIYARSIKRVMAQQLLQLYRSQKEWTHADELQAGINTTREYSVLEHWGLVKQGRRGFWRITDKGRRFVKGLIPVPKVVYLLHNAPYSRQPFSKQKIYFKDLL